MTGVEHLTDKQTDRLNRHLEAGDPHWEVTIAWRCYQQLRSIYHAPSPRPDGDSRRRSSTPCPPAPSPRSPA